ncbi:hypothetical protein PVAG01_07425 [Phlyctema vagabunda]|uniref:BZIP domain-containing protein n=1 Tax=Phlyctema vagabunda TaxID=108571 RepID=A0ABR4PCG5_9HELO
MSQRPTASRPASRASADGQRVNLPPVQLRDEPLQSGRQAEWRPEQESREFIHPRPTLPSPQQQQHPNHPSAPTRDLGVLSILNPAEPESVGSGQRARGGSPPSHFGVSPSAGGPIHGFPSIQTTNAMDEHGAALTRGRRILTPRSPRTVSTGMGTITGSRDAHRSPFIGSRPRAFTNDPGPSPSSEVPPMPTPPMQSQHPQHYGFPSVSTPHERRQSGGMQAPGRSSLSESASPNISTSSRGPSTHASPAAYYAASGLPPPSGNYFPGSSLQQVPSGMSFGGGTEDARKTSSCSSSDPVQVLTITTSQGLYHVPVDVHQASRLADEKRARNAGASARFRQRRKEKEREASTNIEKLQQAQRDLERRLREVEQERDFYRNERDRFRDAVFRTPGMRDMALQAPPSPRAVRSGSSNFPPPASGSSHMGSGNFEGGPERPPRRQRTNTQGEFTPLSYPPAPSSTLPPVQAPGFAQSQTILPPLRIDNPTPTSSAPSMAPAATAAPPPYDPYARGPPPFDRRWSGDNSRR